MRFFSFTKAFGRSSSLSSTDSAQNDTEVEMAIIVSTDSLAGAAAGSTTVAPSFLQDVITTTTTRENSDLNEISVNDSQNAHNNRSSLSSCSSSSSEEEEEVMMFNNTTTGVYRAMISSTFVTKPMQQSHGATNEERFIEIQL
eukprot:comp6342_c0_seq1/m.2137 comp6342_c0_seq1/g.2137  ORF comp6342_c0_seq1/g.2137 comp6342_c0_seq1/m.2137 type:complete len:143 (-) comp6342_c0_seq1:390-818(-)